MTRQRIALLLAALVAASGVLPLVILAALGLQILRQRGERSSQEALQAIAEQAAARIATYIAQQRESRPRAPQRFLRGLLDGDGPTEGWQRCPPGEDVTAFAVAQSCRRRGSGE